LPSEVTICVPILCTDGRPENPFVSKGPLLYCCFSRRSRWLSSSGFGQMVNAFHHSDHMRVVGKQPLQFFSLLSLREIAARASDGLALDALAFELHKAPGTQPTPAPIELLHPLLDIISTVTLGSIATT